MIERNPRAESRQSGSYGASTMAQGPFPFTHRADGNSLIGKEGQSCVKDRRMTVHSTRVPSLFPSVAIPSRGSPAKASARSRYHSALCPHSSRESRSFRSETLRNLIIEHRMGPFHPLRPSTRRDCSQKAVCLSQPSHPIGIDRGGLTLTVGTSYRIGPTKEKNS